MQHITGEDKWDTLLALQQYACATHSSPPLFGIKDTSAPPHRPRYSWVSYGDFGLQVAGCRAALAARGVTRGDKVGCKGVGEGEGVCANSMRVLCPFVLTFCLQTVRQ